MLETAAFPSVASTADRAVVRRRASSGPSRCPRGREDTGLFGDRVRPKLVLEDAMKNTMKMIVAAAALVAGCGGNVERENLGPSISTSTEHAARFVGGWTITYQTDRDSSATFTLASSGAIQIVRRGSGTPLEDIATRPGSGVVRPRRGGCFGRRGGDGKPPNSTGHGSFAAARARTVADLSLPTAHLADGAELSDAMSWTNARASGASPRCAVDRQRPVVCAGRGDEPGLVARGAHDGRLLRASGADSFVRPTRAAATRTTRREWRGAGVQRTLDGR